MASVVRLSASALQPHLQLAGLRPSRTWRYLTAIAVLLGPRYRELEHQTMCDTMTDPEKTMGRAKRHED